MNFTTAFLALAAALLVSAAPSPSPPRDEQPRPSDSNTSFSFSSTRARNAESRTKASASSTRVEDSTTPSATMPLPSTTASDPASSILNATSTAPISNEYLSSSIPEPSSTGAPSTPGAPDGDVVGAVYLTTNNPEGNSVVIASIGSDGNVTFSGVSPTNGKGNHVNDGGTFGADATFTNDIITVHAGQQLLATTNTMSNTVVLYKINAENPDQITMLGAPVTSMGDYPSSVTFNNAGDKLCVMNSGTRGTVLCYDVNDNGLQPQASSLRVIPNYNQTTPPSGPSNTASAIAFTEDEKALVVAVKGTLSPSAPGFLAAWPIEGNGTLADDPTVVTNTGPGDLSFSLTPIPGRNAFLAADLSSAVDVFDFSGPLADVSRNGATASITLPGGLFTCWSAYSPTLDRYYISAPPSSLVVEMELDDNLQPTVIANHTIIAGANNIDVAVGTINGQDYLYTPLTNQLGLAVVRLDGPGKTTTVGVANISQAVIDSGAAIRPNYIQGVAVYIKNGSS